MTINFEPSDEDYDTAWTTGNLCFTQHRAWAEVKKDNYQTHHLLSGDMAIGVMTRKIPLLGGTFGYLPRAFNQTIMDKTEWITSNASEICEQLRLDFLIIEPNAVFSKPIDLQNLLSAGFVTDDETIQPRHTRLIDLKKPDEQLLADMSRDVRRRAERAKAAGYVFSERSDLAGLEIFYGGLSEVAKRSGFAIQPKTYFRGILEAFPKGMVRIYHCLDSDGQLLYALFVIVDNGVFRRIYGGPTAAGRAGDGAQFALLQAIQAAKKLQAHTMDLWGVAPYTDQGFIAGHPLSGVSQFKSTLGGANVTYWPQLILVRNKTRYKSYQRMLKVHNSLKKLRKSLS